MFIKRKNRSLSFVGLIIVLLPLVLVAAGCGVKSENTDAAGMTVFAGIPPVADLVGRIAADAVEVKILLRPGSDPHTFEPTPRQLLDLSSATLFFKIGIPFETVLVSKIRSGDRGLKVIDIAEGVTFRAIDDEHGEHDSQDITSSTEEREESDPHIWLSPPILKILARNIANALIMQDPGHEQRFKENLDSLMTEIDSIHKKITMQLAPYRGQEFFVFHPAFGYFGDAYGLHQRAVELGGKIPTPRNIEKLVRQARSDDVHIIFVQPQFDTSSAEVIARAIDGVVLHLDSLPYDLMDNLLDIADKLERALDK